MDDPYLAPFAEQIESRKRKLQENLHSYEQNEGGLDHFTRGWEKFGLIPTPTGVHYREWAPGAVAMSLVGDFNGWDSTANPCTRRNFGVWDCFLPAVDIGEHVLPPIPHNSKIKVWLKTQSGEEVYRIPAWINRVAQEKGNVCFDGIFWNPKEKYSWKNFSAPKAPKSLRIYEAHVGMACQEAKIGSYKEFTEKVVPYIAELGYNCIQLMAVMEHAYYASFGYQVTNFFAISSRFGTPEDLKELVDTAHGYGLVVLLDLVHSHASKNVADGINLFDGTDHQYFHGGAKGEHNLWDSRLFNYENWEVQRFLLSNLRWYVEEYKFDGFRFDGVTSMLYTHHGLNHEFVNGYGEYFGDNVDEAAVSYLTMANYMLHTLYPNIITIAEDVSGFAMLCLPTSQGGIGFDYRMGMGIPDKWTKLLKEVKDENWSMGDIVHTMTNRRNNDPTVAYCECHDQALVGDKTIAFWLMDKDMYTGMSIVDQALPSIDRGIALHKLIRLITNALGGEAYLNFMGNEFGHPEWIDFPREGNNWSCMYARRQWNLVNDDLLRYKHLKDFDKAMHLLESQYKWLQAPQAFVSCKHEEDKVIAFERSGLLWIFSFHPTKSFTDYKIGVGVPGKYGIVLHTDEIEFGGHNRINKDTFFFTQPSPYQGRNHYVQVYLPCRSALVLGLSA